MLTLTNLHAHIESTQTPILQGVNLTIKPGEKHLLMGPNGSGKSTLGQVILGNERYQVSDGSIEFQGQDFLDLEPDERARAGYFLAFQSPPELDGITAHSLLLAAKKAQAEEGERVSAFRFGKELSAHLEHLHLPESFAQRDVHHGASGGERRKMEIVQLLALQPRLAFLDEVDSGVDIDGLHALSSALQGYMALPERALIYVSHGKTLPTLFPPTHVHVLIDGKIVETGGVELMHTIHNDGFAAYKQSKGLSLKVKTG